MEPGAAETAVKGALPAARPDTLGRLTAGWGRIELVIHPWNWWIVGAVFTAAIAIMAASPTRPGVDFEVFYRAAARAASGESLYRLSDGHWVFKYAPTVSFLFVPFTWIGLRAAWAIFNLISALALVGVMRWGASRLGRQPGFLTHLLIVVFVNPYSTNLFKLGQADALLLWLLVESEELADRRPWISGLLWATACLVKPPFLLFLLPAIGFRQWRRLGAFAAGGLAWILAGLAWFGATDYLRELGDWRSTLATTTPGLLCDPQNQSAWAMVCTYLAPPESGLAFQTALVALVIFAVGLATWAVFRVRASSEPFARNLSVAATLYLSALLSPLGWRTNLLGAIPLLYLLLAQARTAARAAWRRIASVAFAMGLVAETVHRVLGWFLGKGQAHELLLQWRYFGLAVLAVAVATLALAGLEAGRSPASGPCASGRIHS